MARSRNELSAQQKRVRDRNIFLAISVLFNFALVAGMVYMPSQIKVWDLPSIRSGSTRGIDEVPVYDVYGFTYYIFQQLNTWDDDGETDGIGKLNILRCYLTTDYRELAKSAHEKKIKLGQVQGRTRTLVEMSGEGYSNDSVEFLSKRSWNVTLNTTLREAVQGQEIKKSDIQYRLHVVLEDTDPECNPWGLKLDGFVEKPKLIRRAGEILE